MTSGWLRAPQHSIGAAADTCVLHRAILRPLCWCASPHWLSSADARAVIVLWPLQGCAQLLRTAFAQQRIVIERQHRHVVFMIPPRKLKEHDGTRIGLQRERNIQYQDKRTKGDLQKVSVRGPLTAYFARDKQGTCRRVRNKLAGPGSPGSLPILHPVG